MRLSFISTIFTSLLSLSTSTILENGHPRETHFLETKTAPIIANSTGWKTYGPNATELSYKGRWDSKHISWWAAPGLKFAFTGSNLAITFGPHTSPGALIAYRIEGLDWQMTNVTANSTHQLISSSAPGLALNTNTTLHTSPGYNTTLPAQTPLTFELRVTNWALGIQVSAVHVSPGSKLVKVPNFERTIEFIGDSLQAGMYATYESFSGFGYTIGAGLGGTEFSVTAYPGICLVDKLCWDNPRGQTYQWHQTSDTSPRAAEIYSEENGGPEPWDLAYNGGQGTPDLIIINIGTNDNNTHNNVTSEMYLNSYMEFIPMLHDTYPEAQIILMSLWKGFTNTTTTTTSANITGPVGRSWRQIGAWKDEIYSVYEAFKEEGYVHYFNSTGVLQHNDYGPGSHPTDVGHVKIASHVMQYIRIKFGWEFLVSGPEVQHETLYWNDQSGY